MVKYGWYSQKALDFNGIGFVYKDEQGKEVICTSVTGEYKNPYDSENNFYKEDSKFVGIMTKFMNSIHFQKKTILK